METELILEKMTKIFRNVFNDDTINLNSDTTAKDIGSWDSLSHMLMITEVENTFSIKFKLREINKLKNVGSLIELIESKSLIN
jgi:acyl carrier protein